MSTRGGLLSFGSPAASLRVRDVGGPARRRDSGLGSDVLLFTLIISADHLGLSPRILGRWGRKPKSRIVGPRKQGAWGSDGTPAGHPHSGAAPATVRPAPRPRQASPSPPLTPQLSGVASNPLWDRAESEWNPVDGGLSEPHRGRRGPPGRWTAAAKRKARLARKPARRHGLTPFPRKQGAPVAPPHVEPLRRSASAQRL